MGINNETITIQNPFLYGYDTELNESFLEYRFGLVPVHLIQFDNGDSIDLPNLQTGFNFYGTGANDTISIGTRYSDFIFGYEGNDNLNGGLGDDVYHWSVGDGNDTISDSNGANILHITSSSISSADITFEYDFGGLKVKIGNEIITLNNQYDFSTGQLNLNGGIEKIILSDQSEIDLTSGMIFTYSNNNDQIYDTAGDDIIYGVGGNDSYYLSFGGNNEVYAGDGTDSFGISAGNHMINGGNGNNNFNVGAGNHTLISGSGNDSFNVNNDNITTSVNSGDGADNFNVYGGASTLNGENGDDTFYVYGGNHTINAGSGSDFVYANAFGSLITIDLGDGNDSVDLYNGTYAVFGGGGDDYIYTGFGNDHIYGGLGNDDLLGYQGDDTYYRSVGQGNDVVFESSGQNELHLTGGILASDVSFSTSIRELTNELPRLSLNVHVGTETIELRNHYWFDLDVFARRDNLQEIHLDDGAIIDIETIGFFEGGLNADTINGDSYNNFLVGFAGNDIYNFNTGHDFVIDNEGNDKIMMGGSYILSDIAFYRSGYNLVLSTSSANSLTILDHYANNGLEIETLEFADGSTFDLTTIDLTVYGTENSETLSGFLNNDFGDDIIYGYGGNDVILARGGADIVYGGDGEDRIKGQIGNDVIYGDAGDDILFGNEDNDTLYGGLDNDSIYGGSEDDLLYVEQGDDFLNGESGNDKIYGDIGIDYLIGGDGEDFLSGGDNDDQLYGGAGNDELYGNNGDDRVNGDDGDDVLHGGNGLDRLYGDGGVDILYGGEGDDYLFGGDGNDVLYGENGFDKLYGGSGDDILHGSVERGYFYGEDGNDTLIGSGADRYYGGADADTFVFENMSSYAGTYGNVYDFSESEGDKIDISDLLGGYNSLTDDINDFAWFTEYQGDALLRVDADGANSAVSQTIVARLHNETTYDDLNDVQVLINNGTLIV